MPIQIRRRAAVAATVALAAFFLACREEKPTPAPQPGPEAATAEQVRVRHLLIQYVGARGAAPTQERTKAQADSLIHSLRVRTERGEDFGNLAQQFSDDASATEGGEIAPLQPGDTPPDFQRTASALKPGELSQVFQSPYGFHLIKRLGTQMIACQHILIRFHGAVGAPDSLLRGRSEALALAEKILGQLRNPDVSFPVAAEKYSEDAQTARSGGYVGGFTHGRMVAPFEEAAFALQEGQVSGIVETPYGFHIIKRVRPDQAIRVAHILITYGGAAGLDVVGARGRDQALQRALDVLFRARKGEDFAALATECSDDRMTRERGGRLPAIARGQTAPEFEEAVFSLGPGQISDVVETRFGFHVIKRLE